MKWSQAEGLADFDRPCKRQYYEWRKSMGPYSVLNAVLYDVEREVARAKATWGEEFDRRNTLNDWVTYAISFAADATKSDMSTKDQEVNLRKAAGLLVSAITMLRTTGFAPRHFEGQTLPPHLPEIDDFESNVVPSTMFKV
jgi:hypothetical protein